MIHDGNIVDVVAGRIFKGQVSIENGKINNITECNVESEKYILPGLVDAHVHIESSMLVPAEFARMAVVHGTVATISDPHEIANVCGIEGVDYMIENGNKVPFHFHFGAPSCVPATAFETAGAHLDPEAVERLLNRDDIYYLSEMMNYPGVLHGDKEVHEKLRIAKQIGKPIDGHAPGLQGQAAIDYINAGISTDHECFTYEEALHKLEHGMKILIREGSAARNFDALVDLFDSHPEKLMFCSDDKHPDDLKQGHINQLMARAVARGKDVMSVMKAATLQPVRHYGMRNGLLQIGDSADVAVVENLEDFKVLSTYVAGQLVAENGKTLIERQDSKVINQFGCSSIKTEDLVYSPEKGEKQAISVIDRQIVTDAKSVYHPGGNFIPQLEDDLLKMVVVNRYHDAPIAKAMVHNTGLKSGAFASTVAHDSHNIVAIGTNDNDLVKAINLLIACKGGISAVKGTQQHVLPLPVAGLMSSNDGWEVAAAYEQLDQMVKSSLYCKLSAPFMTLSFLALLVIPKLKLSDKGLFDGEKFAFVEQSSTP